jgi:hypothetical protein
MAAVPRGLPLAVHRDTARGRAVLLLGTSTPLHVREEKGPAVLASAQLPLLGELHDLPLAEADKVGGLNEGARS